jgi:hypothetical protein
MRTPIAAFAKLRSMTASNGYLRTATRCGSFIAAPGSIARLSTSALRPAAMNYGLKSQERSEVLTSLKRQP